MPGDITSEFSRDPYSRAPDPSAVGNTSVAGFSDAGARGDHAHAYGRMMGGTVTRVSAFSVGSSVVAVIPWEVRTRDPEGFIAPSLTLPQTDLKVPLGCSGRYLISLLLSGNLGFGPTPRTFLQILDSTGKAIRSPFEQGGMGTTSGILNFNDGDSFQANAYQTSGATVNFTGFLDWVRLGPIQ
jgi:hypothetical protein